MGGWVYEAEVRERAKQHSPLTHAAQLEAPLLVLHGEADIDVPFAQARALVEAAATTNPHPHTLTPSPSPSQSLHPHPGARVRRGGARGAPQR